jgi:hypothetical protein
VVRPSALPSRQPDQIADPGARRAIHGVLTLVDEVVAENLPCGRTCGACAPRSLG